MNIEPQVDRFETHFQQFFLYFCLHCLDKKSGGDYYRSFSVYLISFLFSIIFTLLLDFRSLSVILWCQFMVPGVHQSIRVIRFGNLAAIVSQTDFPALSSSLFPPIIFMSFIQTHASLKLCLFIVLLSASPCFYLERVSFCLQVH